MTQIIIQRILLSAEIFLALVLIVKSYSAYNIWIVRLRSRKKQLPFITDTGMPMLLYFWTSDCAQCKPQEQQIERAQAVLQQSGITLKIKKLNALEELTLTKLLHIMTVPTTVLLNSQGDVARWNPGFTIADTIIKQYHSIK